METVEMSVTLLLDIAASMDPDRVVVGRRGDGLTAARLDTLARGGAAVLAASGAETVVFVGVGSSAFPVALFAAAHAGVPLAPLNYRLSADQLAGLVGRLDRPMVIADEAFVDAVAGLDLPVLSTEEWLAACERPVESEPAPPADDKPAILLFTSGTTAAPKCVRLEHAHLVSYVLGTVEPGSVSRDEAALVSVPPYHVAGVGTVLTNLVAGRRLLYLPNFAPAVWIDLVRDEGVSFAMVVPTMLARIVDELERSPRQLPGLRAIAYGGARMPRALIERSLDLFPQVDFVNAYGLTETSSTIAVLGPAEHREAQRSADPLVRARLGSAGRLIPAIEGQIRSAAGEVLPAGREGELWVRGDQVSGSYEGLGSVLDEDGWFPTRDRALLDEDGYLFLRGRADDTIIRGGENVAPAEIEDRLLDFPGVAEAVVVGLPDEEWGERIAAMVVPARRARLDVDELREWVRTALRSAKTPDEIRLIPDLPRNDTGKVLRREVVAQLLA